MTQASATQVVTVPATTPDVPAVAPMAPLAPQQGGPQGVTLDAGGRSIILQMPRSRADLGALKEARDQISSQLSNVAGRRDELAQKLRGATPFERQGLEQRISVLDARIVQLEGDLEQTGRLLIAAPYATSGTAGGAELPRNELGLSQEAVDDVAQMSVFLVFFPIALAVARLIWKRARPAPASADFTNAAQRLERLEQSVDAIAIEMERVSEGQRFMTRILSEARGGGVPAALGVGQAPAQPIPVPGAQAELVRQER